MTKFAPPEPDYIPARWHGGPQDPRGGIIRIHSTVSPTKAGTARAIAKYFAAGANKASAHYVVDACEAIQSVGDHTRSWDCGWNPDGISIELCDDPSDKRGLRRWDDAEHKAMEKVAARLVAQLCLAYSIRPYFVDAKGLKRGSKGITTHAEVSKAFPNLTTHWDPGAWRRYRFMFAVRRQIRAIKRGK